MILSTPFSVLLSTRGLLGERVVEPSTSLVANSLCLQKMANMTNVKTSHAIGMILLALSAVRSTRGRFNELVVESSKSCN
jgi:hypothetical protein